MARMEERFDQFVDQLSDRMDQLMNRCGNRKVRGTNDEQSENLFGEDDDSSSDEQSGRRTRKIKGRITGVLDFKEVPENKRVSLIATKLHGRHSVLSVAIQFEFDKGRGLEKPKITSGRRVA
ncbi:hypothetical protein Tco_1352890 [Tanacetum coccineum]